MSRTAFAMVFTVALGISPAMAAPIGAHAMSVNPPDPVPEASTLTFAELQIRTCRN